jgi:hypothetical protein
MPKQKKSDLLVANHGSIFLLRPVTTAGHDWAGEHIPDGALWFGGAVAVENRFILDIVEGAICDGLVVSWSKVVGSNDHDLRHYSVWIG